MRRACRLSRLVPGGVGGEDGVVFLCVAGFCHHIVHRVAPGEVVLLFLVIVEIRLAAVDLVEDEVRGIVRLLEDVEALAAGFLDTAAGIALAGGDERVDAVGFHMDMGVDDKHNLGSGEG